MARREDARFVRGQGCFVADRIEAGDVHVAFVRASLPHGRIESIDPSAALEIPGVIGVWTAADLPECGALGALTTPNDAFVEAFAFSMEATHVEPLARHEVTYVGQPIAAVAATSRALAEDGAAVVEVVVDDDGPTFTDSAPAAALNYELGTFKPAGDDVTVELELHVGRQSGVPLETRGVRAVIDDEGRVVVATSTQLPHLVKTAIVSSTCWPADSVVVEVPDVGGGFGTKANVYGEEIVIPIIARLLERPVVWIEDRFEFFQASAQGRDQRQLVRLVVGPDGAIRHLDVDYTIDIGSSSLWTAGMLANTAIHLLGPYIVPSIHVTGRAVRSHRAPSAQYRGAGRPEACFAVERALEAAARALSMSPVELRRRNLRGEADLPAEVDLPYRDGVEIVFDGLDWLATFDRAIALVPPESAQNWPVQPHEVAGWGSASFVEATGRGPFEDARVRIDLAGNVTVSTGAASSGQGHATTFARVAAEALRIDEQSVIVAHTSTADIAEGIGTIASRSMVNAGNAVHRAALALRQQILDSTGLANTNWEISPDGLSDGTKLVALAELTGDDFDVVRRFEPAAVTWAMATHVAVVVVDTETGYFRVVDYAVGDEGGRSVDHDIVHGQIQGGVAQGIGGATLEQCVYNDEYQPQSVSFLDYHVPTSVEVPRVAVSTVAVKTDNDLGVRGVGESGAIGSNAAIANAVDDALARAGVPLPAHHLITATPITQATVLELLDHGRALIA